MEVSRVSVEGDGVVSDVAWPVALTRGFLDCDVTTFVQAAAIVSSGKVTGPRVSNLMERLAIRLEAAEELGDCGDATVAERAFVAIVERLEADLQLASTPLRDEVRELGMMVALYGDASQPPNGALVAGMDLPVSGYFGVAGGVLAIPTTSPKSAMVEPRPEQIVVTESIYRGFLGLDVLPGDRPTFPLLKGTDGVYEIVPRSDVCTGSDVDGLPAGWYRLPGGAGCIVGREVMVGLLNAIWIAPDREKKRGYCYLRVLPPLVRGFASRALGEFPTVERLVDVCPEVYTWSVVDARVFPVTDGGTGEIHYHVASFGRLPPDIPQDARLGAEGVPSDMPTHFDTVFRSFESRLNGASSGARSVSSSRSASSFGQRQPLPSPPRSTVSHLRSLSMDESVSRVAGAARPRSPVFHLQPGSLRTTGALWTEYTDPRAREWANRLAGGPPLGSTMLHQLSKSSLEDLPEIPVAEGGRMVALSGAIALGQKQAAWHDKPCPIPGWSLQKMGATSAASVTIVPPGPGVMCRYEISCDRPYEVNGCLFPEYRTALWADSNLLVTRLGRHAAVWRMWHEAGATALGVDFMALYMAYQCPTVVPARRDKTKIVCAKLVGEDAGRGEQLYRASVPSEPGEAEVHIYVADSVGAEPVVLSVTGTGLVQIMVHGVVVPASGTTATCVTDLASLTVGYCIANGRVSRKQSTVSFEVRRTIGIGVSKGRVVPSTHLLPSPETSEDGAFF